MAEDGDERWVPTSTSRFGDLEIRHDKPVDAPTDERIVIDLVEDRHGEAECEEKVLYCALEREGLAGRVVPRGSDTAEAAGARRLTDYPVVYTTNDHQVVLESDRAKWNAGAALEQPGHRHAEPDEIGVEATLVDRDGRRSPPARVFRGMGGSRRPRRVPLCERRSATCGWPWIGRNGAATRKWRGDVVRRRQEPEGSGRRRCSLLRRSAW